VEKLTIALVARNREKYIKSVIESVLAQTYTDFVFLILDDASTDKTGEIIESFKDPRIRFVRHNKNIGLFQNFNYAIKNCQTPFLLIVHDDDLMTPTMARRQLDVFALNDDAVLVGTNAALIDENNAVLKEAASSLSQDKIYRKNEYIIDYCDKHGWIICPTVMYRMDFIRGNNLMFNTNVGPGADAYLWFNINVFDKVIYVIKEPLYLYRIHSSQVSYVDRAQSIKLFKYGKEFLRDHNLGRYIRGFRKKVYVYTVGGLRDQLEKGLIDLKDFLSELDEMKECGLCNIFEYYQLKMLIWLGSIKSK
jgi:glycosyltransferase involved in cell wall biosynthesis